MDPQLITVKVFSSYLKFSPSYEGSNLRICKVNYASIFWTVHYFWLIFLLICLSKRIVFVFKKSKRYRLPIIRYDVFSKKTFFLVVCCLKINTPPAVQKISFQFFLFCREILALKDVWSRFLLLKIFIEKNLTCH